MIKCVAYARVSTDSNDQLNSIESQKSYFSREIANAKGYKFAGIYADEGFTGTKLNNRPEFNRMLKDAGIDIIEFNSSKYDRRNKKKHIVYELSDREPLFSEIWIKNTSRFARNTLSYQIIDMLRQKKVHIRFIEQNLNTADLGSEVLLKLFQMFDEQDSRDKSLKVTSGIIEGAKRKDTVYTGGNIYGYECIKETNCLEIVEHEAEVIRNIYQLYANGEGVRRIINWLNAEGITTRQGKPFSPSTIKRIIQNEKYIGLNVRMKYDTGKVFAKNGYAKIRPKEDWLNADKKSDKVPAILSDELFYKVQALRESKVSHVTQKGVYKGISEYAGLIYCGTCGEVYVSNNDRGRPFYNCKTKKRSGTIACDNPNISVTKLEEAITNEAYVGELYAMRTIHTRKLKELTEQLRQRLNKSEDRKVAELNTRLEALQAKKFRYVDMCADGLISKDDLKARLAPMDGEIATINATITELSKHNDEILQDITNVEDTIQRIREKPIKLNYNKEEIIADIDSIFISHDRKIEVVYKSARLFMELKQKHDMLKVSDM